MMDLLLERLDAEGVVHWTFSSGEVRDGSVCPMIWDHLLSGDAEVSPKLQTTDSSRLHRSSFAAPCQLVLYDSVAHHSTMITS